MKAYTKIIILLAIFLTGLAGHYVYKGLQTNVLGGSDFRGTTATTVVYQVGPSANGTVTIVPTSTSRESVRIVTTSTVAYVHYGGDAFSYTTAEPLSPYYPLVLDAEHLYIGTITAKATATGTIAVTTFTQ